MTLREKVLFGGMVAAQAADAETTRRYMGIGGTEANPLLGSRPSDDGVMLFKAGVVAVLWGLGEIWPDGREFFFSVGLISGGAAAGWNDRMYERHR
jgi:hypothetical protein